MKIINYGTPLSGQFVSSEDWTLRSTSYPVSFNGTFNDGIILAQFDLPTAITTFDYSEGPQSLIWFLPAQILNDNFPSYGTLGDTEEVILTLPTSTATTTRNESEQESGTEEQDENSKRNEITDRLEQRTTNRSSKGSSQGAYTRTTSQQRSGSSCTPTRQCSWFWCWLVNQCTYTTDTSYEVENYTPDVNATYQVETGTDITDIDQTVQGTENTERDIARQNNRVSTAGENEIRVGGTQTQVTTRSVPAAIRYGMRMARIAVDPQTLSIHFEYNPQAEVRLVDSTGKIGISCMYSVLVEANSIQAIAPGDRSSPVKLPDVINFKITSYMAIRTETEFGLFGSAREEARKISIRDIPATTSSNTLITRETYVPAGQENPLARIKDPTQIATAMLGYFNKLKSKLATSNFGFPVFNKANLIVNKYGQNIEFLVGNQVLTWQDSSIKNGFNVNVVGPSGIYSSSPTPRKSLTFA